MNLSTDETRLKVLWKIPIRSFLPGAVFVLKKCLQLALVLDYLGLKAKTNHSTRFQINCGHKISTATQICFLVTPAPSLYQHLFYVLDLCIYGFSVQVDYVSL